MYSADKKRVVLSTGATAKLEKKTSIFFGIIQYFISVTWVLFTQIKLEKHAMLTNMISTKVKQKQNLFRIMNTFL